MMLIQDIEKILTDSGIEQNEAKIEVRLLIEHFAGYSLVDILMGKKLTENKLKIVEEKAKLFSGWTVAGACNDFGIKHERKCDGDCETCLKEWLLLEVNKKDSTF